MNTYSFTGRLGKDSEVHYTKGGVAICNFTVAVDYGFGSHKGTNWIRCSIFGKRAEGKLPDFLKKGTQVAISGELRISQYEDKSGNSNTSVDLTVEKIDLIGGKHELEVNDSTAEKTSVKPEKKEAKVQPEAAKEEKVEMDDDIPF